MVIAAHVVCTLVSSNPDCRLRSESYSYISSLSSCETASCKALVRRRCRSGFALWYHHRGNGREIRCQYQYHSYLHGWNGITWRCCLVLRTIFFAFQFIIHIPGSAKQKMSAGIGGEIHRRQFALKDIVLIGPAGAELSDWLRVIKREHQAPLVRQESTGKSLRIARSFSSALIEREKQLAQMLVLQWKRQRGKGIIRFSGEIFLAES